MVAPKNFLGSQPTQNSELQVQRMTLLRNEVTTIKADIKYISSNLLIYFNKWTSVSMLKSDQKMPWGKNYTSGCNFKANSHSPCGHPCCCPGASCCVTQILTTTTNTTGCVLCSRKLGENVKCLPQSHSADRMSQLNPEPTCCCLCTRVAVWHLPHF